MNIHYGETDITPEEAGYRTETLERLNALLDSLVESGKLVGASYMMSRGGRVFASRAAGRLRLEPDSPPFTTESIRRIASITKIFTATCILRLVEEGKLWLSQPVADWIPEFRQKPFDRITVFHLLTHTSGIRPDPGYFLEPYPLNWRELEFAFEDDETRTETVTSGHTGEQAGQAETGGDGIRQPDPSGEAAVRTDDAADRTARSGGSGESGGTDLRRRSRWIKALLAGTLRHEPGTEWHYSTAGYTFLGEIIRRAAGMPYEDYFRKTIFDPLGMNRTFFSVPDELKDQVCVINDWDQNRLHHRNGPDDAPMTGGGLHSTLGDLHRFGLMLMNMGTWGGVRILGRKTVELMRRDQFPDGIYAWHWGEDTRNFHIGLGATIGRTGEPFRGTAFGHEGAGRCMLLADPEEQFVAVYLVPSNVDWLPESIINVRTMMWAGLK